MTDVVTSIQAAPSAHGGLVAQLDGVHVHYGTWHALRDVSISVHAGEVVGLLGHNGAGKTTTIRLINGLIRPSGGAIRVFGQGPVAGGAALRRQTSVVTDALGLHERETARQAMAFHAQLWGLEPKAAAVRAQHLLERFGLAAAIDKPVKAYSRGMRQRLALARSILHKPRLLLLDEPTLGMDPVGRREFREILRGLTNEGTAVLMSTHDLGEVERACDNIVILHHGQVVHRGSAEHTVGAFGKNVEVTIELADVAPELAAALLASVAGVHHVRPTGRTLTFVADDRDAIGHGVSALAGAGHLVVSVRSIEPTLEDIYIAMHEGMDQ